VTAERPKGLLVFLSFTVVLGLIALVLSVQNALEINQQADQRNAERIASDLQSCERGNGLRQQVIHGFTAVNESVNQIINIADPSDPVRAQLDEPLVTLRDAAAAIQIVDCKSAVPGAKED
jgi:ATP/maltotriose-dependent transcriptional regulator MalT